MPIVERLVDEDLPARRRVHYRYIDTTVTLDYELDRACLTLICQDFADVPPVPARARREIDDRYLAEYIRQEMGVDFEPERYLVGIGGDPTVVARMEPAAGITIRDDSGRVLEVIHPPEAAKSAD